MSKPLEGIKFAATFVNDQTESDLAAKIRSLGGEFSHKMDSQVKFLVVGKRYTKKYDFALTHQITLISSETFFSIYINWRSGEDVDVRAELLKSRLKPFEGELICLSNMDSHQKEGFHELIAAGGGRYSIAFARVNTILISPHNSGRKIDGARKWGTPVVHPKWISDSVKFGAALNPELYSMENPQAPMEPPALASMTSASALVAGPDASVAEETHRSGSVPVLKRRRGADLLFNGPMAKRDRTASLPLLHPPQPSNVVNSASSTSISSFNAPPPPPLLGAPNGASIQSSNSVFKDLKFGFSGFDASQLAILNRAVRSLDGTVDPINCDYMVLNSQRPSPPTKINPKPKLVTEWSLERSIYLKRNALDDLWSSPVFTQPAWGFSHLQICITGFQGIEQRHATLLTKIVGASFQETLKQGRDLLVAASNKAHKVRYALAWKIPVVNIDWLWQSALAGRALPLAQEHVLDGLGPRPAPHRSAPIATETNSESYDPGNVRYHDDDAEARAQVLMALGEKPSSLPEAEPETTPAVPLRSRR